MTERILNRKNLISLGLLSVLFHAVITFLPYFLNTPGWIYVLDYVLLGMTGFASIFHIAKEQYPIRFQPAQVMLILFVAWYIISCMAMMFKFGNDWVDHNDAGLLNTAVSALIVFPLGYVMIRDKDKNLFGRILLHILLLGWTIFIAFVLLRIFQKGTIVTFNNGIIRMEDGALQLNCNRNTTGTWEMLFFLVCCFMTLWCKKKPLKIIYGISSAVHYTGLVLSNCRAGFLASLIGFMAITVIAVYLRQDEKSKPHKLLTAVIAALIAGAAYYFLSQMVFSLYNTLSGAKASGRAFAEQDQTFSGREQVWQYAIQGIFSSFRTAVFGVTPVAVPEMISQISDGASEVYTHNQFLESAAGIGIPGLCIFLAWLGMIARDSYKLLAVQKDRTLFLIVPVIIMTLMIANMMEATLVFYDYINHYAFFLLCGMLYGKVNEPVQIRQLSRQEIRNKERKKTKKR